MLLTKDIKDKWFVLDIETYPNYNCVGVKSLDGKFCKIFEDYTQGSDERLELLNILRYGKIATYNGVGFDMPILTGMLYGYDVTEVYEMVIEIINPKVKQATWMIMKHRNLKNLDMVQHYDLMKVANSQVSLKLLATRLHSKKLAELPYELTTLTPHEWENVKTYCINDLDVTINLLNSVMGACLLRDDMTKKYGVNMSSLGDARIAEKIILHELGGKVPDFERPSHLRYVPQEHISFKTPQLQVILEKLKNHKFIFVDKGLLVFIERAERQLKKLDPHTHIGKLLKGLVKCFWAEDYEQYIPYFKKEFKDVTPPNTVIKNLIRDILKHFVKIESGKTNKSIYNPRFLTDPVIVGGKGYQMGLGGLHSTEEGEYVDGRVYNVDVASYYPSIILQYSFFPERIGQVFLTVLGGIYKIRQEAKSDEKKYEKELKKVITKELKKLHLDAKTMNAILKLVLNSTFGNTGFIYSKIYDPQTMINVTITGQLMLLMLIEEFELHGITVLSSNTDGIEYITSNNELAKDLAFDWEMKTRMTLEYEEYNGLYSKDVNNYVAVYEGYCKTKGQYSKPSIGKNIEYPIVFGAINEYLLHGVPMVQTINECDDIRQFLSATQVNGGATWKGQKVGKVVRFYYTKEALDYHTALVRAENAPRGKKTAWKKEAEGIGEPFHNSKGGRVSKSSGAYPMMNLPKNNILPDNLCKDYYVVLAYKHLKETGKEII